MATEQATVAEQEYLETMFWIDEAGLPMTGANISRAMQLSAPTVHEMVGRLVKDGYVERNKDKSLAFTASGREHASYIVRRHRMIERFLTDVLGIPWDEVHEEAERIEHAMSPVLEEKMRAAIGDATTCPHGHPILEGIRERGSLLADVEVGADVTVLRFENEAEELLHLFKREGVEPGHDGVIKESDSDHVVVEFADRTATLTRSVGREHASYIVRRHRMIERFLTDVLGIPWDEVHEEAERIEHAMSPVLEERMRAAIGDATTCPHGHPIVEGVRETGSLLADVEVGADVVVLRFENEAEELLHYLKAAGLDPGLEGKVETSDDERVVIASADGDHEVSRSVAETVSVRADPAPPPRAAIPEQLVLSSDRYGR